MPWEENRNLNSLSPHGLKEAQGFAAPALHDPNCVVCREMPPGILPSGAPLGGDPRRASPYMPSSSRPTRGDPASTRTPHTASPHRYGADPGPRESDIITPRSKP
jgi:hypothetical protein